MPHLTVDRAIKEIWIHNIRNDYLANFFLLEDSLKNAFYYHLRTKLTDTFLKQHNLRIYTELYTGYAERIDLAVVKIDDSIEGHLRNKIVEHVAVIELKHKGSQVPIDSFLADIQKIKTYLKRKEHLNCQYYLGFIHEAEYGLEETAWLNTKQQNSWGKGSITELSGFFNEEKMLFTITSYNGLNPNLNHSKI